MTPPNDYPTTIVPVTPTDAMRVAGLKAVEALAGQGALKQVEACWQAMVRAGQ
jgi:hypothetical protein